MHNKRERIYTYFINRHNTCITKENEYTLLDNTDLSIELSKKAMANFLYEQVFYNLDIVEKDYFGVQFTDANHDGILCGRTGLVVLANGIWAWNEKDMFSNITKLTFIALNPALENKENLDPQAIKSSMADGCMKKRKKYIKFYKKITKIALSLFINVKRGNAFCADATATTQVHELIYLQCDATYDELLEVAYVWKHDGEILQNNQDGLE
uniref:FERM N-terminal domain-containing protein n=1 Tax=Glossina palpalis gambiensis TaxID=67801 RepID=A0A1B0BQN5_9MUSC